MMLAVLFLTAGAICFLEARERACSAACRGADDYKHDATNTGKLACTCSNLRAGKTWVRIVGDPTE
jgi:hypothetical protein